MSSLTSNSESNSADDGMVPNDQLTGHFYDGIQEFDNPLPGWWKWLFIGTAIFALPYLAYFHAGADGRTIKDGYENELAAVMEKQFEKIGILETNSENVLKFMGDPEWLAFGGSVFASKCANCHASDGGGGTGPNLCDDYYKNIKTLDDFIVILQQGAGNGAMPAWQNQLSGNEIVMVASYVASLRGSNPAKPQPPLGNIIDAWPEPPAPEPKEPTM